MWLRIRSVHRGPAQGALDADRDKSFTDNVASSKAKPTTPSSRQSERLLVNAMLAGEAAAASRFLERMGDTLWAIVVKLEGAGAQGEAAFLHVVAALEADGYARLKGFDGRARLATYLSLVARDILGDRLARRFSEAPHDAWSRFVRFFESDIRSRIAQQMPRNIGSAAREDAYQEVCLKLIENDFHRIRAYAGRGSFTGYVLTVVDRILIDLIRRDAPRRRLPAAVARSAPLDQAIYAAVVWEGCPRDIERLATALRGRLERDPEAGEIAEALTRVAGIARLERTPPSQPADAISLDRLVEDGGGLSLADSAPTPEDSLLLAEEERSRAALVAAVKAAAADLPTDERLYLQIVFAANDPLPARDIAKLMGYPVEEVYRLKQRTRRWLKEVAVQFEKNSDMSV
ncbi:MAG TPA: sigma-70 family RNA polymerase sigma factor [Xanthobacteraceae bacterium]|nr:sigma-70 family RNA polymerase sigma factor [Xanthobacteraceae bacterium]